MLKTSLSFILTIVTLALFGQQLTLQQKLKTDLSLNQQFQVLLTQSKNFSGDFKLVRQSNIEIIQRNVADSLSHYTKEIATLKNTSSSSVEQVKSLKDSVQTLSQDLNIEKQKTSSISFLGIDFAKSSYHTMVWTIIAILAVGLFIFLFSFKKAKVDAVEHQKTAEEFQNELQMFKKKALETEQKLKRQLLDEQLKGGA